MTRARRYTIPTRTENRTWTGTAWAPGGFDLHDDVTTENTSLDGDDRILTSNEGESGDPNEWASLTRLRTWVRRTITEVADEAAYDALASPDSGTIYWWEE